MKRKVNAVAKKFAATLERMQSRLGWTIIRIPFDSAKVWGTRGQFRVKGEINGFAFRTSLFPARGGGHILLVNKKMQQGGDARVGLQARFRLEPDLEERVAVVPGELRRFFKEDARLRRWYEKLNHSTRVDIGRFITEAKSSGTRQRRGEQMAERLLAVMDAEEELPPVLRMAFAREPRALQGWERMSPSQRRSHLFGIFYYRTPEGQGRRIEKTIQLALEVAERQRESRNSDE